jgi:hypothetical protein
MTDMVLNRKSTLRAHGLDPETYEAMLLAQGGVCAICKQPPAPGGHLDIDHNHETGQLRALLCRGCNVGVGRVENPLHDLWVAYVASWREA